MALSAPSSKRSTLAPWSGLIAGMIGVGLQHQGVGDALHFSCGFDARFACALVGLVAFLVIAIGASVSARALGAAADEDGESTRRFIARTSLIGAALFALMVVWQTIAGFIVVPACMP